MKKRHEPIPLLPSMPLSRRRKRSARPIVIAIVVVTLAALSVMGAVVNKRYRRMADEAFHAAESHFQSGSLGKAQRAYELFRREYPRDERVMLAQSAEQLSEVAQKIDDDLGDAAEIIASLDKFSADRAAAEQLKKHWPVVVTLAERTARTHLERAARSLAARDLDCGEAWLGWLRDQQRTKGEGSESLALADLDSLVAQTRERIAAAARRQAFVAAVDGAVAELTPSNVDAAFHEHDRWRAGSNTPDPAGAALFEHLRQAMRARVRFVPAPEPAGEPAAPVPRLPLDDYTRLSTREQFKKINLTTSDPVFARVKDLCFALEPATGEPRWVLRVGHDAGLPELISFRSRRVALVSWFRGARSMLSLCDAATADAIWSWQSDDPLAGPPVATRDSVFVATAAGTVWQFDLETGSPRRVLELPEPLDGAPTLREDCGGLSLVGASHAVYLIDIAREVPEASDVVLVSRRGDTARCQVLWEPPYVLVFENDLINRCYLRVFFQEAAGYRQVCDPIELDGRVWQLPLLDGARMFLVTDRWRRYCFGLDRNNPAVNLYPAATGSQSEPPTVTVRPHFARVQADDSPFVAALGELRGYRVDDDRVLVLESWNRPPPQPGACCVQPMQTRESVVVATWQEASSDGVLVQAVSAIRGDVVWTTRLGESARDFAPVRATTGDSRLVARTDSGRLFLVASPGAPESPSRQQPIGLPGPASPIPFAQSSDELVYATDGGTRVRRVGINDSSVATTFVQSPPVRSPLVIYRGELSIRLPDGSAETRDGRWALYVAADRSVVLRPLDGTGDDIHGTRLPAETNEDAVWPWPPLVLDDSNIIVAQPTSGVWRLDARRIDDIAHLYVAERRTDLPALAGPPVVLGGQLVCVGRDGRCLALDPTTLKTISDWEAGTAVNGVAAGQDGLFLTLDGRAIVSLRLDAGKLSPAWRRELVGNYWSVVAAESRRAGIVYVVQPSGTITSLDAATGRPLETITAAAPLALAPQRIGELLALATVDGGVSFVPAPKAAPARRGGP